MVTFIVQVSLEVKDLIGAIRKIEYGTLNNVEIEDAEGKKVNVEVNEATKRLVEIIQGGNHFFGSIRIVSSSPIFVEQDFEYKGFKGIKQIKLG